MIDDSLIQLILSYYLRAAWSGKTLPKGRPGDDVYQLGGNAILSGGNENGKGKGEIVYTYKSQNPADRPTVEHLIKELEK